MNAEANISRRSRMEQWLSENAPTLLATRKELESAKNSERVARYAKARASRDPEWKATLTLRHSLASILVRKWARMYQGDDWWTPKRDTSKCMEICGCSLTELRQHFEKQFREGMEWRNHGRGDDYWVIDHVRPICLFDWWTHEGRLEAFRWSNLQPLWGWEHRAKSNHDAAQARKRAKVEPELRRRLDLNRQYAPDLEGTDEEIMARLAKELGDAA